MPYYAGDHWHRSRDLRVYTRGDPGLFSFVKKAVRAVGGVVKSPLGGLAMSLIPGAGWIKTGFQVASALAGGGGAAAQPMAGFGPTMEPGGYSSGGTPGHVAQRSHALRQRRVTRRRTRRRRRSY